MRFAIAALLLLAPIATTSAHAIDLETEDQKMVYAVGFAFARGLAEFDLSEDEIAFLVAGLSDSLRDRPPAIELDEYSRNLPTFAQKRRAGIAEKERVHASALMQRAEAESGALKTDSGLVYREVEAGSGNAPKPTDVVSVHYHGTLYDGSVFDSSKERGQPARFALNGVIPCWTEALQRMKVGGKALITCPAEIAYGDRGKGPIRPGAALRFEVELLAIESSP